MKGGSLKNYPRCWFQYERFLMNAGCGPLMNAYRFPVKITPLLQIYCKVRRYNSVDLTICIHLYDCLCNSGPK